MRTLRAILALTLVAAAPLVTTARRKSTPEESNSASKVYAVNKSYTTLSFTATKWMVLKEEGLFQTFSGTLTYNPADPAKCAIDCDGAIRQPGHAQFGPEQSVALGRFLRR